MKNIKHYIISILIIFVGMTILVLFSMAIKLLELPDIINILIVLVIIFFISITTFKIFSDYNKYGKKIFKFKTELEFNEIELIAKDIEKIDTYQKMIIKNDRIILINKAGVFEIVLINKKGVLKGNIKDEIWHLNDTEISNPFVIKDDNKYNYFIVSGYCLFQTDAKLVNKSNIYYEILKHLNKNVYDDKKIMEIYEVLNGNN